MKSFVTRVISALVALAVLFSLYHFLGNDGFKIIALFAVLIGAFELIRILFKPEDSKLNRFVFYIFVLSIFLISARYPSYSAVIFAFFSICFCLISLLTQNKFEDLASLTAFQAKSIMGFLYIGLLPSFAVQIIDLPRGATWFLTLLVVVFFGDIGAYAAGLSLGKRKLMPSISPKKTIEGAIGGLITSAVAGMMMGHLLVDVPTFYLLILSLVTAVAGQFGDLFESQLKRVADLKDSGGIMPGHGGVLDRLDGVLFACPIIYLGAMIIEHQL
jgi:phosphatidate cytidylyltransferase